MFSSARCCGDKLENVSFQKLEKPRKTPLIFFCSYFAVVNEALVSDFPCGTDSLVDVNTHISLLENRTIVTTGQTKGAAGLQSRVTVGNTRSLGKGERQEMWNYPPLAQPAGPRQPSVWG